MQDLCSGIATVKTKKKKKGLAHFIVRIIYSKNFLLLTAFYYFLFKVTFYITTKWHRIVFRCELGPGSKKIAVNCVDQSKMKKKN